MLQFLPTEPIDLKPYELSIKTWGFWKITSDFNPFLHFILSLQEQYSDPIDCGIWIQDFLPSTRNWQLNGDKPQELDSPSDSQHRPNDNIFPFKFFI